MEHTERLSDTHNTTHCFSILWTWLFRGNPREISLFFADLVNFFEPPGFSSINRIRINWSEICWQAKYQRPNLWSPPMEQIPGIRRMSLSRVNLITRLPVTPGDVKLTWFRCKMYTMTAKQRRPQNLPPWPKHLNIFRRVIKANITAHKLNQDETISPKFNWESINSAFSGDLARRGIGQVFKIVPSFQNCTKLVS